MNMRLSREQAEWGCFLAAYWLELRHGVAADQGRDDANGDAGFLHGLSRVGRPARNGRLYQVGWVLMRHKPPNGLSSRVLRHKTVHRRAFVLAFDSCYELPGCLSAQCSCPLFSFS